MTAGDRYIVGLSCGDAGTHAVLAAVSGSGEAMAVRQVRHEFTAFEPRLGEAYAAAASGRPVGAAAIALLDRDASAAMAAAAEALLKHARVARRRLAAVGLADAVLARPEGGRCRIGTPATVAQRARLPVVSDFAAGDLAAGGRGGPVAAWAHWLLFRDSARTRVVVDLGRVASLTFLPTGAAAADVVAFDTGPGTAVIDALAADLLGEPFDRDGAVADRGRVDHELLAALLNDTYFHRRPPKLTSRHAWSGPFTQRLIAAAASRGLTTADMISTATELTVRSVAQAVAAMTENPHDVLLCGGGTRNITLAMRLRSALTPASTVPVQRLDFDATALDAVAAAILAAARLDRVPTNIPQTTGAARPALCGSLTEP
ncbi:MAG: hypothetical protein GX591_06340 [Planctomycetes bacterium]|nr:hypothetical protein [Planctomycetota bacterium]